MTKSVLTLSVTAAFIVGAAGVGLLSSTNTLEAAAFTLLISGQFLGALFVISKRHELYPDSAPRRAEISCGAAAQEADHADRRSRDRTAITAS